MSTKSLLERYQGRLFTPRYSRQNKKSSSILGSNVDQNFSLNSSDFKNTNIESTSSFRYGDKPYLVSTQQLRVDWSRFENHTFFHSAVANVNESFDKLVNFYPFDKSKKDVEQFEDQLTGYEKYILNKFPKNVGYLNFSGTSVGESLSNGTQIVVKDRSGTSLKGISDKIDGAPILDPRRSPFSVEFFIKVPKQANDNQVIFQKKRTTSDNITIALSQSNSTSNCEVHFAITSGSNFVIVSGSVKKGEFSHVTAMYDRLSDQRCKLLVDDIIHSSSQQLLFEDLHYNAVDLKIGAGDTVRLGANVFTNIQTFSGSLDDLRYFHSVDPVKDIKKRKYRSFYPSSTDPTLKLYYRFNEPYGSYTGNNIVLDSSGNSLHEKITNFSITNRLTSSDNPVKSENTSRNPVLFPTYTNVSTLNTTLLTSASNYDDYNPNLITNLIPKHYFQDASSYNDFNVELDKLGSNFTDLSTNIPGSGLSELPNTQMLIKLLLTYAKFYDELKLMIDGITSYRHVDYEEYDTTPDIFLLEKAKLTNTTLPYLFTSGDVAQFILGLDLKNNKLQSARSLNEVQNLIWRRILTEAPKMNLQKGTVDSIKSIFRSAGIEPDNILSFREYGGSKKKSLNASRELKKDVFRFLIFTGSYNKTTSAVDPNGYPTNAGIPRIKSGYLSGSRIEIGAPQITKTSATGTVTLNNVSIGNFYNTVVRLTDAAGVEKRYILQNTATSNTGNTVNLNPGSGVVAHVVVGVSGLTRVTAVAQLVTAIHSANGHNGTIVATNSGSGVLSLKQLSRGIAGNQSIVTQHQVNDSGAQTWSTYGIGSNSGLTGGAGFQKTGNSYYHGTSTTPSDGLFTSGSFTYEALYDWEQGYKSIDESLVRMHVTGSTAPSSKESCIVNLVGSETALNLYVRDSLTDSRVKRLYLTGVNVFDKNVWYVSFGKKAGHDLSTSATSSYFLRAAKQKNGDLVEQYVTASFFEDRDDSVFKSVGSQYNASGSFLVIGSQSFQGAGSGKFLNDSSVTSNASITNFHGLVTNIRFFSKNTTQEEYINRAKNYDSFGVADPKKNYNYTPSTTGSFERLILHTDAKQGTKTTTPTGGIRLFDFSQNNLHFEGSNFENSSNVMKNLRVNFEVLSDKFDINFTNSKVRVRSFQDSENLEQSYFSTISPVYEILPSEESLDDNRLSLDMSVMKGLNENILKMFNNFDALDDALGRPNLLFTENYQDLRHLRTVYFNNVLEVLNLQKYRELFKWIDNSFTDVVYSLIPRTTNFLGINFIYESHLLERNRFRYYYDEIYLKSGERDPETGNIFLSQFVGRINKM